jgi:hypothetical protein
MKTLAERFWEKIDVRGPDDCWLWKGGASSTGYGGFGLGDRRTVGAHRLAYELVKGPIPDGLCVLHSCDNKPCCNPSHLWAGTRLDNMRDASSKGRIAHNCGSRNGSHTHPESVRRGERQSSAKLTERQVREARKSCAEGHSQSEIGRLLGVNASTISLIVLRKTWREVSA